MFGAFSAELLLDKLVIPITVNQGLCLSHILSDGFYATLEKVNYLTTRPNAWICSFFNLSPIQNAMAIGPVLEEFEIRYLLQQVLLRDIPQSVLKRVFPDHEIDLSALPIKLSRAVLCAAIFSLLHTHQFGCTQGGGMATFMGGLITSGLIESGHSAVLTASLHLIWNQYANSVGPILDNFIDSLQ